MPRSQIVTPQEFGVGSGENAMLEKRPYINSKGQNVVAFNTHQMDQNGQFIYKERAIQTNATLRKDEWVNLEDRLIEAFRERLVIIDDLRSGGLTYNAGGLGTLISEWETGSEITDAEITMDGESKADKDGQEFGLDGVPIPVVHKEFTIGERMLQASRSRGAGLDVTTGLEAARSVARRSEHMVFNGAKIGKVKSASNSYGIPGLTTFDARATFTISDWSDPAVTPQTIHGEILQMVKILETQQRRYGPFKFYIPGAYAFRFREDYKTNSDKTLMERVLDEDVIDGIRISDVLEAGNVVGIDMKPEVIDLAIASDITTVQWASGSGWTNEFQVYAAWAPRLKADFDGRTGVVHGSTA